MRLFGLLFLAAISAFSISCGKKEPPRLTMYDPPPKPANLSAIRREAEVNLKWDMPFQGSAPLKGYAILRAEEGGELSEVGFTDKGAKFKDAGIKNGVTYTYAVSAKSIHDVASPASGVIRVAAALPPDAPLDVSFSIGPDYVEILWKKEAPGVFYNVYKSPAPGNYSFRPHNKKPLSDAFYRDSVNTVADVHYHVRALANTPSWDESPPSAEVKITPGDYIPATPSGLEAVSTQSGIQLLWKENPEIWIKGYMVFKKNDKGEFDLLTETQFPAYADKDVKPGAYSYRITALGPKSESKPSAIKEAVFTAPKQPPLNKEEKKQIGH